MNILYLILHTKKQPDRYYNIINTWAKNKQYIFCSDHNDQENNIYQFSDNDSYDSGQEKQINCIKFLPERMLDFDWYFFCDNDTFVNTKLLEHQITQSNTEEILCQAINTWPVDFTMFYPSGGAGFLMSKSILHYLKDKIEHNNVIWGDVSVGLNIKKHGIKIKHSNLLKSQPPDYYNIALSDVHKYLSFHYIKDEVTMTDLYNRCNNEIF